MDASADNRELEEVTINAAGMVYAGKHRLLQPRQT